jgi:hypothetical protein
VVFTVSPVRAAAAACSSPAARTVQCELHPTNVLLNVHDDRVHMESYAGLPIERRPDVFAHSLGTILIHGSKALTLCTMAPNATASVVLADGDSTPGSLLLAEVG